MRGERRTRSAALRWLVLVLAAASTGFVHSRMDTSAPVERSELRIPEPRRAKLSSLGFEPVVADYYWVQTLHLVGGLGAQTSRHGDTIGDLMELVTTLDPWVDHPYRFAALWMTHSVDQVRRANAMLRKAISYHPDDWRNRFYLGYNRFYYLHDNAGAADVLEPAISMEGAPNYLGAFVARLRADGGDLETAALFLRALIDDAPDEYVRAEYLKAWDEIETERRARMLDAARAEFWKRHRRDIRDPRELWKGPRRVLQKRPPPHPHFPGFGWELDPETNEIVSTFYKSRYRLHVGETDAALRERWRRQLEQEGL